MKEIDQFIEAKSSRLLDRIDSAGRLLKSKVQPLDFVGSVLDEWAELLGGRELPEPASRERTFWFTLYQYEELAENDKINYADAYVDLMRQNLVKACDLLRRKQELPEIFFATRPGEYDDFDPDDDEW